MQSCHNGHAQFTQQGENVAARPPAKNSIFELQANEIDVVDIQEIGGASIRLNIFFRQFKSNAGRVSVAAFDVVDGQRDARGVAVFGGDGLAEIGGERGNAALARQVVTDKRNPADGCLVGGSFHDQNMISENRCSWSSLICQLLKRKEADTLGDRLCDNRS